MDRMLLVTSYAIRTVEEFIITCFIKIFFRDSLIYPEFFVF